MFSVDLRLIAIVGNSRLTKVFCVGALTRKRTMFNVRDANEDIRYSEP